jgi:hypothetical protein
MFTSHSSNCTIQLAYLPWHVATFDATRSKINNRIAAALTIMSMKIHSQTGETSNETSVKLSMRTRQKFVLTEKKPLLYSNIIDNAHRSV